MPSDEEIATMFLVVVSVVGIVVLGSLAFGIQSLYIPAALAAVGWAVGVVIRYVRRHRALARSAASRQLVHPRRVRARLGLALGVADLVLVVVLLLANLHYDGVTWHVDPR